MKPKDREATMRQFVELVLGDMQGNAVLGLMDKPGPRGVLNRFADFKYPEQLDEIVDWAVEHRNEDAYISPLIYGDMRHPEGTPNAGKIRRVPENALFSNTAYQDSDTCEIQHFRLHPSIHVTTSSGRYQDYWILADKIPADEAATISRKIAVAHRENGSDPSSWSANKMLRLPATNTRHGFPEDVTVQFFDEVYFDMDLLGAYEDIELEQRERLTLPASVSYESEQDLPPYAASLDKLPSGFDTDILTKEVPDGVDRSRMRYRMLLDLFRTGSLDFEEVLSIAWHAPNCRKWKEDSRNIRGLIGEALKAQAEVAHESGEGISAAPEEFPLRGEYQMDLLTDTERAEIAGANTWLRRWDEWARSKLGTAYNAPYVRMDGISVLSAAFSDAIFMPMSNGPQGCNMYTMALGDSGSGKSSTIQLYRQMMRELFPDDKGWNIGTNASPNALHEKLLERDKRVTVLNADEAHGWFAQLNNGGSTSWTAGILEMLAEYYDGYVPPILRTGNRDASGKDAATYFLINLRGTRKGKLSITNVLNDDMILSGFLARFVWYYGEDKEVTEDSMEVNMTTGDYVLAGYEPMCRQWAAEFADTKKKLRLRAKTRDRVGIQWDNDAKRRVAVMKWAIDTHFRNKHPKWELLEPSLRRISNNMMRLATLFAVEEGSETVQLKHVLLAMEHCEEWLTNVVTITESISASDWKRQCDEIVNFIATKGERARKEVVLRKFATRKGREIAEQISDLISQGRLQRDAEKGVEWLRLKV